MSEIVHHDKNGSPACGNWPSFSPVAIDSRWRKVTCFECIKHCPTPSEEGGPRPGHYTHGDIEVIDAIEAWGLGFRLGNVVKYVARADHKGNAVADLKKARDYLTREINARNDIASWLDTSGMVH